MEILILGGGTVGGYIAKRLSELNHAVTVVERRRDAANEVDQHDIRVVVGDALQSAVLFKAGATTADVCFALTSSDEANLLAGSVAKGMGARRVAARVNSLAYRDYMTFDYRRHFEIDRFLSQDYLTAIELARRIREPGAMLIEHFASGELEMQEVVVMRGSEMTGKRLAELKMPREVRVGAITRDGDARIASADDRIEVGDRVTLVGSRAEVESAKKALLIGSVKPPYVAIIGGGEIGFNLASILTRRNYTIKILERNYDRCQYLARRFSDRVTIVRGDGRRRSVLDEHGVGQADFAIACAGDDEYNILACVEAVELGATTRMAIVKHADYASVVGKLGVTEAVSPYDVMGRQAEGFTHKGALVFQNSTLLSGSIQVVELEVGANSAATRTPLRELRLPKPSLVAAAIRDNSTLIPHADFVFAPGDAVVAFAESRDLAALVKLFEE